MGILGKKPSTLTVEVPGMHCGNCERRVQVILESVPGIASVKPTAADRKVVIRLDPDAPASEQTIREELAAGGYPTA